MTLFELVKAALNGLYAEAQVQYGEKVDEVIKARLTYLTDHYKAVGVGPSIDYKDPATRFAYVYKYTAAHGDYVVQVLERARVALKQQPIFFGEQLRVSCIGGGPGSDIAGILKFLANNKGLEPTNKVICYLLDKEQAWADSWTEIDDQLSASVALHANFQPLDVTNPTSWESQKKFMNADLFTLSYFLSEVRGLNSDGSVSNFLQTIFANAKPGAIFLYVDNSGPVFNQFFDPEWKKAGLVELISVDEERFVPTYSEQSSVLNEYKAKFDHSSKLQAKVGFRVLVKPPQAPT